jgi:hypothetical protein
MEAVGLGINPPPSGFDMLNTILGIQQKKQQLQIQSQALQQQQLVTQQNQGVNQFFTNWSPGDHLDNNGVLDLASAHQSSSYQGLSGVARAAVDDRLNSMQNGQLANMKAKMGLNQDAVAEFGQVAQAGATGDPQAALDEIKRRSALNPSFAQVAALHADAIDKLKDNPTSLSQAMGSWGAQTQAVLANRVQPANTAAGQAVSQNPQTLARNTIGGNAPNPTTPQIAGETTRQVGTGNADIDRGNQISAAVQPATNAIAVTNEIDGLADQIHSGKFAAAISKAAAAAGQQSETYARQVIEKDINRLRTLSSTGSTSDAQRDTINGTIPPPEADPQTIHNAMDYVRGTFKQNLARSNQLNQVKAKDSSLQGFQHADDIYTAGADPLMHEFQSLSTQQQQTAFLKRHFVSKTDAQQFIGRVAGFNHVTGQ